MKTKIIKVKGDWIEVLNDCRSTVNKVLNNSEPSNQFKRSILIAEHSPIRDITFKWKWEAIKSWISVHWVRHKWECFVSTQRTDRTGVDRDMLPQSTLVDFVGEANVQALIDTMRKRLCFCASSETREYAEDLKMAITDQDPFIGYVLVPNCVYRGGCPEMNSCGLWYTLRAISPEIQLVSIYDRYEIFNNAFRRRKEIENDSTRNTRP